MKKNYEELDMTDDFMFGKIMSNKELCRETLETLLEIPIEAVEFPERQKSINITSKGKSVRLDVYVQDEKETVYDAEMQQGSLSVPLIRSDKGYIGIPFVIYVWRTRVSCWKTNP